jgi:hypothetical protein
MNIKNRKPEIYERLNKVFGVNWDDGIIITYGDTIYCKYPLTPEKIAHETIHTIQQQDPVAWWDKYIEDVDFRISQELEAYKAECEFIKKGNKSRNEKYQLIRQNAIDLSSFIYGNIISFSEAYKLLK